MNCRAPSGREASVGQGDGAEQLEESFGQESVRWSGVPRASSPKFTIVLEGAE